MRNVEQTRSADRFAKPTPKARRAIPRTQIHLKTLHITDGVQTTPYRKTGEEKIQMDSAHPTNLPPQDSVTVGHSYARENDGHVRARQAAVEKELCMSQESAVRA